MNELGVEDVTVINGAKLVVCVGPNIDMVVKVPLVNTKTAPLWVDSFVAMFIIEDVQKT